jgi:WD40 repeat protein
MTRLTLAILCACSLTACNNKKASTLISSTPPGAPAAAPAQKSEYDQMMAIALKPRVVVKSGIRPDHDAGRRLELSRDGTRLAISTSKGDKTQIWDLSGEPKKVKELKGTIRVLSPDGKRALQSIDYESHLVNVDDGKSISKIPDLRYIRFWFRSPELLVGAYTGATANEKEGVVRQFECASGKELESFPVPFVLGESDVYLGLKDANDFVVVKRKARKVDFWSVASGKRSRAYTFPASFEFETQHDCVSHDGKWFVFGHLGGFKLYDPVSTQTVVGDKVRAHSCRFVPSRDLVVGHAVMLKPGTEQTQSGLILWDIGSKKSVGFLPAGSTTKAFSADGKVATTWSENGDILVFDIGQIP